VASNGYGTPDHLSPYRLRPGAPTPACKKPLAALRKERYSPCHRETLPTSSDANCSDKDALPILRRGDLRHEAAAVLLGHLPE
jgi:hypothetical protein